MAKQRRKPRPVTPAIRRLARKIAHDLFTDGSGKTALRLVHEHEGSPLSGGGWGEPMAADHIAGMLAEAWPDSAPGDPQE